jgi:F420-0:gamma-glutamyl ligase-like protein
MSEVWERSADVLWRRTATGVVVLPNNSSTAVALVGLQAALWESLVRPLSVTAIAGTLAAHLPEEPTAAEHVIGEEVRHLVAIGAVRESND